jgi:hypothetical protein
MRALRTLAQVVSWTVFMTGYPQTDTSRSMRRRASTTLHRISEGLGARPPHVNLAGPKS